MVKSIQVKMTLKQYEALHEYSSKADVNISELIRRVLIEKNIIPDDEIQHGGYRERKPKANKQ